MMINQQWNQFFITALPISQFCFIIIKNKIVYRILKTLLDCLGITLFVLLSIYVQSFMPGRYMLYLTSWGCLITSLYFLFSLISSIENQKNQKLISHSFLSVWFITAFSFEFAITIVQWTVIYNGYNITLFDFLADGTGHIFPLFFLVLDSFENKIMVKSFKILIFPYGLFVIYFIFVAIYTLKMGPIYQIITFTDVWAVIFLIVILVLLFIGFLIFWLFSRFVKSKYEITNAQKLPVVSNNNLEAEQNNGSRSQ